MEMAASNSDKMVVEQALEKAAKMICNLKCGVCPIREKDFQGCLLPCGEETRPWQCWVAHFKSQTGEPQSGKDCR
ncbi:MAG: hypothetical protein OEV91_05675 [Desulfobulbaceae bacterium]|nr:hypothetical protein [Desulfobulbaceae bacterium]